MVQPNPKEPNGPWSHNTLSEQPELRSLDSAMQLHIKARDTLMQRERVRHLLAVLLHHCLGNLPKPEEQTTERPCHQPPPGGKNGGSHSSVSDPPSKAGPGVRVNTSIPQDWLPA